MVNLVRAAALSKYAEVARQYGLNPVSLLRKHSMSLRLIADPERRIPILPVLALLGHQLAADAPAHARRRRKDADRIPRRVQPLALTVHRAGGQVRGGALAVADWRRDAFRAGR